MFDLGEYWIDGELVEEGDGDFHVYDVTTWPNYRDAFLEACERAGRDDLIVIDNITWPWDTVKTWYVQEVYGVDMTDWVQQYRMKLDDAKGHSAQESIFEDWGFINPNWYGLHSQKLVKPPCHLVCTANAKSMRTDGRVDKEHRNLYETIGMAPDTQKRVGGQLHTVLYLFTDRKGFYYQTAKDRGRDRHTKTAWDDFAVDYLEATAEWTEPTTTTKTAKKKGFGLKKR